MRHTLVGPRVSAALRRRHVRVTRAGGATPPSLARAGATIAQRIVPPLEAVAAHGRGRGARVWEAEVNGGDLGWRDLGDSLFSFCLPLVSHFCHSGRIIRARKEKKQFKNIFNAPPGFFSRAVFHKETNLFIPSLGWLWKGCRHAGGDEGNRKALPAAGRARGTRHARLRNHSHGSLPTSGKGLRKITNGHMP